MRMTKIALLLSIPIALLLANPAMASKSPELAAAKRTEVRVSEEIRMKFRQPSELLRMVTLTPILDENDEVRCVEIAEIRDPVIKDILKANVGDCLTEVSIYREERNGTVKEVYPVLSAVDALLLYKDINGASKVEVNLQRKKQLIPMTYVVN
jgi:hypothetical protein